MVNAKAVKAFSFFCFVVFAIFYSYICQLLFGSSRDDPLFIISFQITWCVAFVVIVVPAVVFFCLLINDSTFAYVKEVLPAATAQSLNRKETICTTVGITLIQLMLFLCTFFILFTDAKNNPQWMTALLVFWCIYTALLGVTMILVCCVCCCLICDIAKSSSEQADTNPETRPFANQTTTTSV
jgi:hypothetical protein